MDGQVATQKLTQRNEQYLYREVCWEKKVLTQAWLTECRPGVPSELARDRALDLHILRL